MVYFVQDQPATLAGEPISAAWLLAEPMLTLINRSSAGIGLFRAVRQPTPPGQGYSGSGADITDFYYDLANPVLEAIARVTPDDLYGLPLSALIPEGVQTDLIRRMARVVETGRPHHYVDEFELENLIMRHDQLCLKVDDGVLVLVMDVTYLPLSAEEHRQRNELIQAIDRNAAPDFIRTRLMKLIG